MAELKFLGEVTIEDMRALIYMSLAWPWWEEGIDHTGFCVGGGVWPGNSNPVGLSE